MEAMGESEGEPGRNHPPMEAMGAMGAERAYGSSSPILQQAQKVSLNQNHAPRQHMVSVMLHAKACVPQEDASIIMPW